MSGVRGVFERVSAGEEQPQREPRRVHIGSDGHLPGCQRLGRKEGGRARCRHRSTVYAFGVPEVAQLRDVIALEEQIPRLDVSMKKRRSVASVEPREQMTGPSDCEF